jgi:hypothetical protein
VDVEFFEEGRGVRGEARGEGKGGEEGAADVGGVAVEVGAVRFLVRGFGSRLCRFGGEGERRRGRGRGREGSLPNIDENKGLGFEDFTPVCAAVGIRCIFIF